MFKGRVTDMKRNSRVIFPEEGKDLSRETFLEMVRFELLREFRTYIKDKCNKEGEHTSNLNAAEKRGLKSLKKGSRILIELYFQQLRTAGLL